jgi:hypothetical protein
MGTVEDIFSVAARLYTIYFLEIGYLDDWPDGFGKSRIV